MKAHAEPEAVGLPHHFVAEYYVELSTEDRDAYASTKLKLRAESHFHAAKHWNPSAGAWVGLLSDVPADEQTGTVVAAVCDDSPFLVDSLLAELTRRQLAIRLVVHPRFVTTRTDAGELTALYPAPARSDDSVESWIAVELRDVLASNAAQEVVEALRTVLADVSLATADWQPMQRRLDEVTTSLPDVVDPENSLGISGISGARKLLKWLKSSNFVFVGYRQYTLERGTSEDRLIPMEGTGLGVLRKPGAPSRVLTGPARESARKPVAAIVTKARARSTVHRDAHLDYIGIKTFDAAGVVTGEHRFLGLFTSSVYNGPVETVPLIEESVGAVMARSGFPRSSHSGRQMMAILETYPRDELFQIDSEELFQVSTNIMGMQERRRSSVFQRRDAFGRFVTVLVYLPRDRYNTAVRVRIERELRDAFGALDIEHEARVGSSALARIFFTVWTASQAHVDNELEQRVRTAVRSWAEGVHQALLDRHSQSEADKLTKVWSEAFPPEYQVRYSVEMAALDIERFEALRQAEPLAPARLYIDQGNFAISGDETRLRLYLHQPQSLSRILPYFEHLGLEVLEERPHEIADTDGKVAYLYDLLVRRPAATWTDAWELVPDAFHAALGGEAESDVLNTLVLQQGFDWRVVALLRSYAKYFRQLGTPHSFDLVSSALLTQPGVTRALADLFQAKFNPALSGDRSKTVASAEVALTAATDRVTTLDAAFVLETLGVLIKATVRTNFYQYKSHISVKFDPAGVKVLPSPRPAHEIWVYSPRVEGVHLRFGLTARGGLRWSDRPEDFRTEVLGLVKAQTVKNAVIVPDGAKGGFYAKRSADLSSRDELLAEGQECYRTFISGLLDLTDNLTFLADKRNVVSPPHVICYDGPDSYLVVAADKGTAAFSDIANDVAASYGYWLGDAFASGGSVGYDHKKMGITARGAWESTKTHFSELGLDTSSTDFTVTGVGDMSGDVFGNGMLLSKHIRLVAAFDHRHIFLDPTPNASESWRERARLFKLPRSSWDDYDRSLISEGGGVWPRNARSIPVHPAAASVLGLSADVNFLTPPELLRAILTAPVDLLYNGGIGTYVKASHESHSEAGDRANDAIRVNGNELRARVVVEGGNLGVTQAGRVEAALTGVLINTDAIDNSAGVDCSDHEVNIKILVDQAVRAGDLSQGERTSFLAALTDEIAGLVLADNVAQNVLLLTDRRFPPASFPNYERLMQFLEGRGELDRSLEFLPGTGELEERIAKGRGLTSPELAVLAAYSKNTLMKSIRHSTLVRDPFLSSVLTGYFPAPVVQKLGNEISRHPLRDDIVATVLANDVINIGGITSVFRLMEETSADEVDAVKAFVVASELFGLRGLSAGLVQMCADLPAEKWSRIYLDVRRVLDRAMRWFIQYDHQLPLEECLNLYRPVVEALRHDLPELLKGQEKDEVARLMDTASTWGLPADVVRTWGELRDAFTLLDIARVRQLTGEPLESIAPVYFAVRDRFRIEALLDHADELPRATKWEAMARATLRDDIGALVPELTVAVLGVDGSSSGGKSVSKWERQHHARLSESEHLLQLAPKGSFEALSAYVGTLRKAARS